MEEEKTIWKGKSSQVKNLGTFIICGLTFWLIIPIFIVIYKWLDVKFKEYEITTERLRITKGILSKRTDDWELYRVKDTSFVQPFFLRLFSLGNIVLSTSDRSATIVVIDAIPNAKELQEEIRKNVEMLRDKKKVREVDFR